MPTGGGPQELGKGARVVVPEVRDKLRADASQPGGAKQPEKREQRRGVSADRTRKGRAEVRASPRPFAVGSVDCKGPFHPTPQSRHGCGREHASESSQVCGRKPRKSAKARLALSRGARPAAVRDRPPQARQATAHPPAGRCGGPRARRAGTPPALAASPRRTRRGRFPARPCAPAPRGGARRRSPGG